MPTDNFGNEISEEQDLTSRYGLPDLSGAAPMPSGPLPPPPPSATPGLDPLYDPSTRSLFEGTYPGQDAYSIWQQQHAQAIGKYAPPPPGAPTPPPVPSSSAPAAPATPATPAASTPKPPTRKYPPGGRTEDNRPVDLNGDVIAGSKPGDPNPYEWVTKAGPVAPRQGPGYSPADFSKLPQETQELFVRTHKEQAPYVWANQANQNQGVQGAQAYTAPVAQGLQPIEGTDTRLGSVVNLRPLDAVADLHAQYRTGADPAQAPDQVGQERKTLIPQMAQVFNNYGPGNKAILEDVARLAWYRQTQGKQGSPEAAPQGYVDSWIGAYQAGQNVPLSRQLDQQLAENGVLPRRVHQQINAAIAPKIDPAGFAQAGHAAATVVALDQTNAGNYADPAQFAKWRDAACGAAAFAAMVNAADPSKKWNIGNALNFLTSRGLINTASGLQRGADFTDIAASLNEAIGKDAAVPVNLTSPGAVQQHFKQGGGAIMFTGPGTGAWNVPHIYIVTGADDNGLTVVDSAGSNQGKGKTAISWDQWRTQTQIPGAGAGAALTGGLPAARQSATNPAATQGQQGTQQGAGGSARAKEAGTAYGANYPQPAAGSGRTYEGSGPKFDQPAPQGAPLYDIVDSTGKVLSTTYPEGIADEEYAKNIASNYGGTVRRRAGGGNPSGYAGGGGTGAVVPIDTSSPQAFGQTAYANARRAAQQEGFPEASAKIAAAMAANESGWGKAVAGNNFFGIKGSNPRTGANTGPVDTWEVVNGKRVNIKDTFRSYDDPSESFRDFYRFLKDNPRYAEAIKVADNPAAFIQAIKDAGYMTDPDYVDKIHTILRMMQLSPNAV